MSSAAASTAAACGVSQSRPPGPRPTTSTRPDPEMPPAGTLAGAVPVTSPARATRAVAPAPLIAATSALTGWSAASAPAMMTSDMYGTVDGSTSAARSMTRRRPPAAQPPGQLLAAKRARQHGEHVVALDQRHRERRRRGAHRGDPGHDHGGEPAADPLVHVHVAAVKERVALGQ